MAKALTPPLSHPMAHGTLHMAHWALLIAYFGTDLARLRSLQVDPLLDESIELRQMLGSSLKTLRTRSDLAPTDGRKDKKRTSA